MTTDELLDVAHCMSPHEAIREALPLLKTERQATKDLAMLLRRTCHMLRNEPKSSDLRERVNEYLVRRGLQGTPIRMDEA